MDEVVSKTNQDWYSYIELGTFFKLENGILIGCPMNADGTRDDTPFDVDWERGVEEKDENRLLEVVEELKVKE